MYNTHNWMENYLSSESEIKVCPGLLGLSETGIVGKGQRLQIGVNVDVVVRTALEDVE